MQKTILITGCSGQLGYNLCHDLSGYFNVIPTYKIHKNKKNRLNLTNNNDFKYIFSIYNPDIIINCGALTDVDYCEDNRKHCRDVNVIGLNKLITFSSIKTKIIHISSDYVFDGLKGNYKEEDLTHPINYYGKSKLESENILIGSNRDHLIFRVNMLFDNFNNNFFTWVLNNLKNRKVIKVAIDLISNPTWIQSFSNIIIKSIYLNLSGLFHYGTENSISRFEFAQFIAKEFNYSNELIIPIESSQINFNAKRPKNTRLVSDKLSNHIDITIYNIEYILKLINQKS